MAKIIITRNTVCGKKDVFEDDIVDASEEDSKLLIALKKAIPFTKEDGEKLKKKKSKKAKE